MTEYDDIIATLKRAREERNLSIAQGARKIGTYKAKLNNWERGTNRPKIEDLQEWADKYSYRVILKMVPKDEPEGIPALLEEIAGIDADMLSEIVRYARVLKMLDGMALDMMLGSVASAEAAQRRASSGARKKGA